MKEIKNKVRTLAIIIALLSLVYVYTYFMSYNEKTSILNAFKKSLLLPSITGFYISEEEYLGNCSTNSTANGKPYFNCTYDIVYMQEDDQFIMQICYNDPENDTVLVRAAPPPGEDAWNKIINGMNYSGFINITPNNSDVGIHKVSYLLQDACHDSNLSNQMITYYVNNTNDPPYIINYTPEENNIVTFENTSLNFTVNYNDDDLYVPKEIYNESLSIYWKKNESLIKSEINTTNNNSNLTISFDFCSSGTWLVKVEIKDLKGSNASVNWTIIVNDVNREPYQNESLPSNITILEDNNYTNVLHLDDYFYDPDFECGNVKLNYSIYQENYNVTFVINNESNLSIYPKKDWFGNLTIQINFSDGYFSNLSEPILIIVNNTPDPPYIEDIGFKRAAIGINFSYKVNASDADNEPITFYDNTSLFDIDPDSGWINFTPQTGQEGIYHINISVKDASNNVSWSLMTLEIINNQPPIVNCPSYILTYEKNNTVIDINFSDPNNDSVNITDNFYLFDFKNINNSVARATFIPYNDDVGNHSIEVNFTDEWNFTTTCNFELEIKDINNPPILSYIPNQDARYNFSFYYKVTASDEDNDPLTFKSNSSLFNISENGEIYIEKVNYSIGNYTVKISVYDTHNASDEQDVIFFVTLNYAPYFINLSQIYNCTEDVNCIIQIYANDSNNDKITYYTNNSVIKINESTGLINFTYPYPRLFKVNITIKDSYNATNSSIVLFNISEKNDRPIILNQSTLYIVTRANRTTKVELFIYDEEGDNITIIQNDTSLFTLQKINNSYFNASFIPSPSLLNGNDYVIKVIGLNISDSHNVLISNITVKILPPNTPPQIINVIPSDNFVYTYETNNISFYVNATDTDINDTLRYEFYLNDNLVSTNNSYLFTTNWYSAGLYELKVYAYDSANESDSYVWNIRVYNVNRPVFAAKRVIGYRNDLEEINNGTFNNVTFINNSFILENGKKKGYYITPVIKFYTQEYTNPKVMINITSFNNTRITWQYSYSLNSPPFDKMNEISWSEFSNEINETTYIIPINSTPKYWKFKINFYTNNSNSPIFKELIFSYEPTEKTVYMNTNNTIWIYLPDWFYDLDKDDSLSYSYSSSPFGFKVTPEESWPPTGWLYITPPYNYEGNGIIKINVSDSHNCLTNKTFSINVVKLSSPTGYQIRYEIKTKTETVFKEKIVEKEVPKYESFNLIVPESMTMYPNDSVVVPILLDNYGNETLKKIHLFANTSKEKVSMFFTKDYFETIPSGKTEKTELIITTKNVYGGFDVTIKAVVEEPKFNDTAKLIMKTLEKGEHNESQIYTKIAYTEDLLRSNKECLELNEMVEEAKKLMKNKEYEKAIDLLNNAVEACKYLVATQPTNVSVKEKPLEFKIAFKNKLNLIIGLVSVAFIVILVIIYWISKPK